MTDEEREECRAYWRAYYAAHRDEELARRRAYREAHRDEINARRRAKRAACRASTTTTTPSTEETQP